MIYKYKTKGTCSRQIIVEMDEEIIKSIQFVGGCAGNSKGIALLVQGMKARDVITRLKNIDCAGRGTSCPDQLSKALDAIVNNKKNEIEKMEILVWFVIFKGVGYEFDIRIIWTV